MYIQAVAPTMYLLLVIVCVGCVWGWVCVGVECEGVRTYNLSGSFWTWVGTQFFRQFCEAFEIFWLISTIPLHPFGHQAPI